MRLIGREKIIKLGDDRSAKKWLAHWTSEISHAHWKRPGDIRGQFPRCTELSDGSFVFPVHDGPRAVRAIFHFSLGIALIQEIIQIEQP